MARPLTRAPTAPASDAFLSRGEAWALVACQPLAQLSNQALLPSLGAMRDDLGLSYAELGWVVAAFGLARLLVDLPAGSLATRWNPRSVLVAALGASAIASGLGVFAVTGLQVATVRLLMGVGSSIAQAMILTWIVGGAGRAGRGRVLARSEALFSLSGVFIPAIGGLLAGPLGWRVAFVMGSVAAASGLLAILLCTRASSAAQSLGASVVGTQRPDTGPPPWSALLSGGKALLAAYLATFIVFFCRNGMLNAVLPVLGADKLGIQPFEIGLLFSVLNGLGIGAVLLGGRCGDRFGRFRMLLPGLGLLALAQALLFAIHDPLTYALVGLVQGLACFVNPLPTIVMGDALSPWLRARGIAVYRAVCDLAQLSAPALLGIALQLAGFPAAQLLSLTLSLLVLASVSVLYFTRLAPNRLAWRRAG